MNNQNNLSAAHQITKSSLTSISKEIKALLAVKLPPISINSINQDFAKIKTHAEEWPSKIEPLIKSALQKLVGLKALIDQHSDYTNYDDKTLVALINELQKAVSQVLNDSKSAQSTLANFHAQFGADASAITTDRDQIQANIDNNEKQLKTVQGQLKTLTDQVAYYKKHPGKLILASLSLISMFNEIKVLKESIVALTQEKAQMVQLQDQIRSLQLVISPLDHLTLDLNALELGLMGLNTNLQKIVNDLSEVESLTKLPSNLRQIVIAELETVLQELQQAIQLEEEIMM